jgi:predicted DCC family thiol-disulfide oxidoreductase YuxK
MNAMKTHPVVQFVVAGEGPARFEGFGVGEGRPYAVVYDGTCTICGRFVTLLRKWDRKRQLELLPSQAPGVMARFPWIPARAYMDAVQLIGPGGRTWQGAAAVEQILDVLPKGKLLSWLFSIPFVRPLADRFYKWFARNRYKMGCGAHCQLRALDLDYADRDAPAPGRPVA